MSSKLEFVEYVAEQCRGAGEITLRNHIDQIFWRIMI